MADETEGQHDEQPENQQKSTPRKVNPDGGSFKQTELRDKIAEAMGNEMLTCSVDGFLEKLAPFSPDAQWVDLARKRLKENRLLGTPAETTLPVVDDALGKRRSTRIAAQARVDAERVAAVGEARPEVDAENVDIVEWEAYRDTEPGQMEGKEMEIFKPLEEIVNTLLECPDPSGTRRSNGYCYKDCPYTEMESEIMGSNFRVDAVIANPDVYKTEEQKEGIAVAAAQTAVVMEFKKDKTADKVYENRKQLVSAANHIMNDDPRRNWMYGITIENTEMSLWYFSRSYSMKSAPFNFTKDFETFIRVFLSFLYASDEELGHDPSIHRTWDNNQWCYVYALKTETSYRYYRTIEPLYNPRSYCITGRKSRVWKVVEVSGPDKLRPRGREVVLKDCWVDGGSLSEKEIQDLIFGRLARVEEADYAWAPDGLKDRLRGALARPETYFMKVELDWKEVGVNKEKPQYNRAPNLLLDLSERRKANGKKIIPSSQISAPTGYPSNTNTAGSDTGQRTGEKRGYKVKQHYRVVYADVGESLAHATEFSDAVRAFEDIFIALTLLFLARWVHRDVSEGNIILVRNEYGVSAKLSDLEYARDFDQLNRAASTDPKTGTAYFMPLEIHSGNFLSLKSCPDLEMGSAGSEAISGTQFVLRYNFAHDLESLWWVMVWIVLRRVKGSEPLQLHIFTVQQFPHEHRRTFFTIHARSMDYFQRLIHASLRNSQTDNFLALYNRRLVNFYNSDNTEDTKAYSGTIYSPVWKGMEIWVRLMGNFSVKLKDLSQAGSTDSQELGKRARSTDSSDNGAVGQRGSMEGPSERKKQKPSEGGATADTVQDMAGIVREECNPRIRETWLS